MKLCALILVLPLAACTGKYVRPTTSETVQATPARLARVSAQHAIDSNMLSVDEILDRLWAAVRPANNDALSQRIAYRTIAMMAATAQNNVTTPEVAALIDDKLHGIGEQLAGDTWSASLSRKLLDPRERAKLVKDVPRSVPVPPGDPIGGGESDWMDLP